MEIRFDDYNAYPDSDIREVRKEGILLSTGQFIDYAQCAANFYAVHGGTGTCVGEREIGGSDCTVAFYTAPLTTHIVFVYEGKLREFIRKETALRRYQGLCRKIAEAGYTTMDAS